MGTIKYKTFQDLIFKDHHVKHYGDEMQALIYFDNGYGASVVLGKIFNSNGVDTYELAILHNGGICYTTHITKDVLPNQTSEQITEILKQIQDL